MFAVYWNWGHENAGSVMMFCGMLLCFVPGSYYYFWSRRMKARPEDDPTATQASGAGVVGAFPRHVDLALHARDGRLLRRTGPGLWYLAAYSRTRTRGVGTLWWHVRGPPKRQAVTTKSSMRGAPRPRRIVARQELSGIKRLRNMEPARRYPEND